MKKTKELVDEVYRYNYDYLFLVAFNILKKSKHTELVPDLVNESYLYILDNLDMLEPKIWDNKKIKENIIISIAVNYMSKQIIWSSTKWKKIYQITTTEVTDDIINNMVELSENDEEELIRDELIQQNKQNIIQKNIPLVSKENRIVYELYSGPLQINNSGKLSRHLGLPRSTCWEMIVAMKKAMTEGYNGHNN